MINTNVAHEMTSDNLNFTSCLQPGENAGPDSSKAHHVRAKLTLIGDQPGEVFQQLNHQTNGSDTSSGHCNGNCFDSDNLSGSILNGAQLGQQKLSSTSFTTNSSSPSSSTHFNANNLIGPNNNLCGESAMAANGFGANSNFAGGGSTSTITSSQATDVALEQNLQQADTEMGGGNLVSVANLLMAGQETFAPVNNRPPTAHQHRQLRQATNKKSNVSCHLRVLRSQCLCMHL